MSNIITFKSDILQFQTAKLQNSYKLSLETECQYAILGANGSGKSLLSKIIENQGAIYANGVESPMGRMKIKCIEFRDIHSVLGKQESYYQQRFHACDNDDMPTIADLLNDVADKSSWADMAEELNLKDILNKKVNYLSSGELRKYLIIRALLTRPDMLIIDNPYIGLDKESREVFDAMLHRLSNTGNITIILLLNNPVDIPTYITHVIPVKNSAVERVIPVAELNDNLDHIFSEYDLDNITLPTATRTSGDYTTAFSLDKCVIRYGARVILDSVSWEVKKGEKWALLGENGAGKSTLLSVVCADNPQSYANNIITFDKKRGAGESIWEVKSHIGYVSPEMHLYFNESNDTLAVVASGYFDTVGMFRKCNEQQLEGAREWMRVFKIEHLADKNFRNLSTGEQRLVLLCRAFVKDPELVILDEPLHGLDVMNKRLVKRIIENFCAGKDKSLVYVTHYENEIPNVVNNRYVLIKKKNS